MILVVLKTKRISALHPMFWKRMNTSQPSQIWNAFCSALFEQTEKTVRRQKATYMNDKKIDFNAGKFIKKIIKKSVKIQLIF